MQERVHLAGNAEELNSIGSLEGEQTLVGVSEKDKSDTSKDSEGDELSSVGGVEGEQIVVGDSEEDESDKSEDSEEEESDPQGQEEVGSRKHGGLQWEICNLAVVHVQSCLKIQL